MKILDYGRFVEKFNIDKIDIKKVETEKIIWPGDRFPEPGKTVKESVKPNMIAIMHIINTYRAAYIEKHYCVIDLAMNTKEKLALNDTGFYKLANYDDKLYRAESTWAYAVYVSSLWELYGPLRNELLSLKEDDRTPSEIEIKLLLEKAIKAGQKPIWTVDKDFEKDLLKRYDLTPTT